MKRRSGREKTCKNELQNNFKMTIGIYKLIIILTQLIQYFNQKAQTGWQVAKTTPVYMLSTTD